MRVRSDRKVTVREADETRDLIREFMSFEIGHVNHVVMKEAESQQLMNPELKRALRQSPYPRELQAWDENGDPILCPVYDPEVASTIDPDMLHLEENEQDVDESLPRRSRKKDRIWYTQEEMVLAPKGHGEEEDRLVSRTVDVYHGMSDDEWSNSEEEDFSDGRSVYSDELDREIDDDYDEW